MMVVALFQVVTTGTIAPVTKSNGASDLTYSLGRTCPISNCYKIISICKAFAITPGVMKSFLILGFSIARTAIDVIIVVKDRVIGIC
jgi:hypothetical protein